MFAENLFHHFQYGIFAFGHGPCKLKPEQIIYLI